MAIPIRATAPDEPEVTPVKRRGRTRIYKTPEQIAAAAAERAARKKARLAAPAPDEDPAYAHVSLQEIRHMRKTITEEETRVSYWRRLVQARLDLLQADQQDDGPVKELSRVLADANMSHQRIARVSVGPVEGPPPLPDLATLWDVMIDPSDSEAVEKHRAELEGAERQLSAYRRELHRRLDEATGQLIARYRKDPMLALSALPGYEWMNG